jgi:hypothetical protein
MCLILPTGELPGESAGGPVTPAGTSGTGHVIALEVVVPPEAVGTGEAFGLALACGAADGAGETEPPGGAEIAESGGLDPTVAPEPQPASATKEMKSPDVSARRTIREFFHAPLKYSLTFADRGATGGHTILTKAQTTRRFARRFGGWFG